MFKGQSSVEFLMVVALGLVIISPFIVTVQDSMISVILESDAAEFEASLDSMQGAVHKADALGDSSKVEFRLNVPRNVKDASLYSEQKAIIYEVEGGGGSTNYTRFFDVNVSGDLPKERGRYAGIAEGGEEVEIKFLNWDAE